MVALSAWASAGLTEDELFAEVTVSTAHRAKGREWNTVRIFDDFLPPLDSENVDEDGEPIPGPTNGEARLAYVAVTRARHCLDLGGLSWIDEHPDGHLGAVSMPTATAGLGVNVWEAFGAPPAIWLPLFCSGVVDV